jgi:FMN-dependent NADH-azoreductase
MFYILYEIENFSGNYQAGPYSQDQVIYHMNDISGFSGVFNVQLVSAEELDMVKQDKIN